MNLNLNHDRLYAGSPDQDSVSASQHADIRQRLLQNLATAGAGMANATRKAPDPTGGANRLINTARQKQSQPACNAAQPDARADWNNSKLGRLAMVNGDFSEAMNHFQRQYESAKRNGCPDELAEAATDLAYMCVRTGSPERAGKLYALALKSWQEVRPEGAIRSPRMISAFALFLHDYADYLARRDNPVIAERAKRRLEMLANRFSAFTVYSALAKRLRERGQHREAKMMVDQARPKLINRHQAAYTAQIISNVKAYEERSVFLPPLKFSAE